MLTHPTGLFWETIFRPLGSAGPSNFTRPTSPINCISSRTWGAGRPQVGLCPIFLVIIIVKGSPSEHIWDEASVWCRWWRELSLTNFFVVAVDIWVNNLETLIGQSEELVVQTWLKSWFYSKWVNICWILWISHVSEAWKEVWLSGDTGYSEIPASRDSYFRCDGYLGPEFRPGNIAMSSVWCSYRFKWIEHLLKLIFGLVFLSDVGSTRLVKSSKCLWW